MMFHPPQGGESLEVEKRRPVMGLWTEGNRRQTDKLYLVEKRTERPSWVTWERAKGGRWEDEETAHK